METIKEAQQRIKNLSILNCGTSKSVDYVTVANREQVAFLKGIEFAQEWIPISRQTPNGFESGDFDGKRSDFVLVKNNYGEVFYSRCYQGFLDGSNFCEFVDDNDNVISHITHWRPIERF